MDIRYELAESGYTLTNKKTVVKLLKLSLSINAPVRAVYDHRSVLLFAGECYMKFNTTNLGHMLTPERYW